jgi:DNA-binding NtrC family response regulator
MSGATSSRLSVLRHRRILVVEDEYMIAQEIADVLVAVGAEAVGPVPRVSEAMQLLASEGIEGALLDVNLHNEAIWPVVDALRARHVPVVLATGYDVNVIPPAYAHLPRCEKPVTGQDIIRALARALADAGHT